MKKVLRIEGATSKGGVIIATRVTWTNGFVDDWQFAFQVPAEGIRGVDPAKLSDAMNTIIMADTLLIPRTPR